MDRVEKAIVLKHNGHNCCQAVVAAYADDLKITPEMAKKLGAAFGLGMGCMEGNCGALCGAQIVLGLREYNGRPILPKARMVHEQFKAMCGDTICRKIKGIDTGKVLCSCDDCVRNAVRILEA